MIIQVSHYSTILIEWIKGKEHDVTQKEFRQMLNKILAKEGQVRKSKIVNEMRKRQDIARVCRSAIDLFLNYINDEFFHDVSITFLLAASYKNTLFIFNSHSKVSILDNFIVAFWLF